MSAHIYFLDLRRKRQSSRHGSVKREYVVGQKIKNGHGFPQDIMLHDLSLFDELATTVKI